jgi:hypothetical protein
MMPGDYWELEPEKVGGRGREGERERKGQGKAAGQVAKGQQADGEQDLGSG